MSKKEKKGSPMPDSNILEKLSVAAAEYFYDDLLRTEDFRSFESLTAISMRIVGANAICKCLERFDADLCDNIPDGWVVHERASRTIITLLGAIEFTRTIFLDKYGRRRALLDELLGIVPRMRLSSCSFLWIATHVSELSYRKTAAEFTSLSGVSISHVTVMNVVHKEGALLKETCAEFARKGTLRISQDTLFIESDGLWVHLQETKHREKGLPRFLYEQARKTKSFELKIAALYAGKARVAPGRYRRAGLCLTCLDADADVFWERV